MIIVDTITIDNSNQHKNPDNSYYFYNDKIFIVNQSSLTIFAYNSKGQAEFQIDGKLNGNLISINDIVYLSNKHLIVLDAVKQKIVEFDSNGIYQKTLVDFSDSWKMITESSPRPMKLDSFTMVSKPDAHIIGDSIIYIRGSEHSLFNSEVRSIKTLYRKFTFPSFKELARGGHFPKQYNRAGYQLLENCSSIVISDSFYYILEAVPYITKLNTNLEFEGYVGENGNSFRQIEKELNQTVFRVQDVQIIVDWLYGKSSMDKIFHHGNFTITTYRNNYSFNNYFENLYRKKFNYYQSYLDSLQYYVGQKDNEYWCQVYSKNLNLIYGEIRIPTEIIGYNSDFIYMHDYRKQWFNEDKIIKCRIEIN